MNVLLPLKISVIVIIVIAPLFIMSYFIVDRFVVRQKLGDLMNLADAKYVNVLDMLDFGKKVNRDWASNPDLRQAVNEYEQNKSETALSVMQDDVGRIKALGALPRKHAFGFKPLARNRYDEVLITDSNGIVLVSTGKSQVGEDLSKTAVFREKDRKTFVSDVFRKPGGKAVFAFVSPIFEDEDNKGSVLGYLITEVDAALLTMIINADLGNIIGGKLWFAGFQYKALDLYIMDRNGWMITQSRLTKKDTVLKQKGSKLPLERGLDTKATGDRVTGVGLVTGAREAMEIYKNRKGVYVAGASMHIFDEGWTVVIEQDTADAFAGLYFLRIALIVSGLIAAFLAGLAAWLTTKHITDSLAKMGTASVKLAGGDVDTQVQVRPREYSELAVLAASMNLIADFLRKSLKPKKEEKEK